MDVVVSRCAGIDIGKAEVVVCLRVPGSRGKRESQVRTFSAVAGEINRLADWLAEHQVSHVVMEATGQYWKPVWDVLAERGFELMLVNARHVKMVPGRKTDVADATWLAELLEHGLLRGGARASLGRCGPGQRAGRYYEGALARGGEPGLAGRENRAVCRRQAVAA